MMIMRFVGALEDMPSGMASKKAFRTNCRAGATNAQRNSQILADRISFQNSTIFIFLRLTINSYIDMLITQFQAKALDYY